MFLVGPPQGRRDTPGDLLASGSCKHGHGHALPLLAGATYSIGLSTPPIFTFFPRDPAARSSNRSGIWDHGMSKSSWLKFRFIRNSVAFLSLFFFPQFRPNPKHKLWEPGASWRLQLLSKIDFSVSAAACSANLAAERWAQLEPCFAIQQKFSQLGAFQTQQIIF